MKSAEPTEPQGGSATSRERLAALVFAYIALAASVVVAADWWFFLYGQSSAAYVSFYGYDGSQSVGGLAAFALIGIILDIVAGAPGGRNRRIGLVAGIILASPLVVIILSFIWPNLLP